MIKKWSLKSGDLEMEYKIVDVKRISDRLIAIGLVLDQEIISVSTYFLQVG